jgi:hypothetical protein
MLAPLVFAVLVGAASVAQAQPAAPTAQERVAALKESLARSEAGLKQYEWIETTSVSLKGEEKSNTQKRCYYGADGKKQEVLVVAPPPEEKKRGIRGMIIANKKEELSDYMKQAVALVKSYVPPNPAMIQASKDAGKLSVNLADPGKKVRLEFKDYLKAGDKMSLVVDLTNNTLTGLKIDTWLSDAKDVVTLDVKFGALNDGTSYPATITLDAPSQNLGVVVTNSGYRRQ